MINLIITPIINYGKRDFLVLSHILLVLGNISLSDFEKKQQDTLVTLANFVIITISENFKSKPELEYVNDILMTICESGYFNFTLLGV
ncbi:MAG: hypothetical protein HC906_04225 [Bacteroidales bacterium]|nr:hypothetical protein [Bacteroidales bacterium]